MSDVMGTRFDLAEVDGLIEQLEAQFATVTDSIVVMQQAISQGNCTNDCTYVCTNGCTGASCS